MEDVKKSTNPEGDSVRCRQPQDTPEARNSSGSRTTLANAHTCMTLVSSTMVPKPFRCNRRNPEGLNQGYENMSTWLQVPLSGGACTAEWSCPLL